jgi:hypothetical protein
MVSACYPHRTMPSNVNISSPMSKGTESSLVWKTVCARVASARKQQELPDVALE